jgi:Tfp pilus assembly protein PilV
MSRSSRDTSEWIVHGRKTSQPWVVVVFVVVIAVLVVVGYQRFMAFETISYELRTCERSVAADASWSAVEASGCRPLDSASGEVVVYEGTSRHAADSVDGARFVFDRFPVNSTAHSVELTGIEPAESVLIAEPTHERIRRAMSGNAAGTAWTGFIGDRGPTEYWLLIVPADRP